jgi:hypothetical protein
MRTELARSRELLGRAMAETRKWRWWHDMDSRRNKAGLPDLLMVRGNRLVFAELKRRGGKVSQAQQEWLDELERCTSVEAHVWFPDDFDRAREVLL